MNKPVIMTFQTTPTTLRALALVATMALCGCSSNHNDNTVGFEADPSGLGESQIRPADGQLHATVRRTTGGVPHVLADDLASAAFGAGFAQAQDNVCLIAEAILKVRGERAQFFGPGVNNDNVASDFSYRALRIHAQAETEYLELSPAARALIDGFTAGYNRHVSDVDPQALPPACRAQPWVRPISPVDLSAYNMLVAQYASGDLFANGLLLAAVPPGESPDPIVVAAREADATHLDHQIARLNLGKLADQQPMRILPDNIASNAWGIGTDLSEQGRGALLANPHFPYTGTHRLYQTHLSVPGVLDVNGAGLIGVPIPLISFNQHLAWSHTVSTSRRFTLYELELVADDPLAYVKDGETRPITPETYRIQIANGTPTPTTLEKTFYYSEYGPMLPADLLTGGGLPAWGAAGTAYTYRDANASASGMLDTWLGLSRATSLTEFQAVFEDCGSTLWTNTTYADDAGNAWYIDSSSVPNLSEPSLQVIAGKRAASAEYERLFQGGLTLLDGNTSRDDWEEGECAGRVPFADRPQLLRSDFVQNSNASHWATNPAEFLTGYSPLFGNEEAPVNARTRLGLMMVQNPGDPGRASQAPAGQDGKFSARELLDVIWNNRGLYAELWLDELLARCDIIGETPVNPATGGSRSVAGGCAALAAWNGTYDNDSVGAPVYRVFLANYLPQATEDLQTPFDAADPVNTPASPSDDNRGTADDRLLQSLAAGLESLDAAGIAYDVPLGDVQRYRVTGGVPPEGTPEQLADPIAWHGGTGNTDGVFNAIGVVNSPVDEDTRFPRLNPPTLPDTEGLSATAGEGWWIGRGTSWHFGLEFTDAGPEAWGLVSYSQSTDPGSPWFADQSQAYSVKEPRKLLFTEQEILDNLLPDGETIVSGQLADAGPP